MEAQDMASLMADAIMKYPEAFSIMNNVNRITASYEPVIKKWIFFLDHKMPIVTDATTLQKIGDCVRDIGIELQKLNDYVQNQEYLEDDIRGILIIYANELGNTMNELTSVYMKVISIAFVDPKNE